MKIRIIDIKSRTKGEITKLIETLDDHEQIPAYIVKAILRKRAGMDLFALEAVETKHEGRHQPTAPANDALPWRPIGTAPDDVLALFWIRPKRADEIEWTDTSGRPIPPHTGQPRVHLGVRRSWGMMWVADAWLPIEAPRAAVQPAAPADVAPHFQLEGACPNCSQWVVLNSRADHCFRLADQPPACPKCEGARYIRHGEGLTSFTTPCECATSTTGDR